MGKEEQIFSGTAWTVEAYFASDPVVDEMENCIVWSEPGFQVQDHRAGRTASYIKGGDAYVTLAWYGKEILMIIYDEDQSPTGNPSTAEAVCAGVIPSGVCSVQERLPKSERGAQELVGSSQIDENYLNFYHILAL